MIWGYVNAQRCGSWFSVLEMKKPDVLIADMGIMFND